MGNQGLLRAAMADEQERADMADVLAFVGNSLLKPMSQTAHVGLNPAFWEAFPCFEDEEVAAAVKRLAEFARRLHGEPDAVTEVCVEYTQLFVGPPKPEAFPWESYYVAEDITSGFGEPTYEMQRLLREAGLRVSHEENNQYADHMGIELLLLSELCRNAKTQQDVDDLCAYSAKHPASWANKFHDAVASARPDGYFEPIVALAVALVS